MIQKPIKTQPPAQHVASFPPEPMGMRNISIAVVGGGMGGLAVAATLRRIGADVQVYEQAHHFARVGAGIQMLPNAMKVLRGLEIEDHLRRIAFEPISHLNREWD